MKSLLDAIEEHQKVFSERSHLYENYCSESSVAMQERGEDTFRLYLLRHLAAEIVVKEHRNRYQKEQFDRFMASARMHSLKSKHMSLSDFCYHYALLIETKVEHSHGDKCPKIEANYDDWKSQTIRPINSTIFYYFFSANRAGKLWA